MSTICDWPKAPQASDDRTLEVCNPAINTCLTPAQLMTGAFACGAFVGLVTGTGLLVIGRAESLFVWGCLIVLWALVAFLLHQAARSLVVTSSEGTGTLS